MHERIVAGVRADAIEDVIVAERRHLDQFAFADEPGEIGIILRQREMLLAGFGDLHGEKAPSVAVVLQLGGRVD